MTNVDESTTAEDSTETKRRSRAQSPMQLFKNKVRRVALQAQRNQGWDAADFDKTLIRLGLDPVHQHRADVSLAMTFPVAANDGETADQLRERIEGWDSQQLAAAVAARPYTVWNAERTGMTIVDLSEGVEGETDPIALGDDLDAYKRFVRKVAIEVGKDKGWCDGGVNEYLDKLELPQKRAIRVPVRAVRHEQTYVQVDDAYDMDEAYASLADPEQLRRAVEATHGSGSRLEVEGLVDFDELRPGDPDSVYGSAFTQCTQRPPHGTRDWRYYTCTREAGHTGQHIVGDGSRIMLTWLDGMVRAFTRQAMPPEGWTVEAGIPEGWARPDPNGPDPLANMMAGDDAAPVHQERNTATGATDPYSQTGRCDVRDPEGRYGRCSRAPGHQGDHIACTGYWQHSGDGNTGTVVGRWPAEVTTAVVA
jgi:hypothetical protein